MNLSSCACGARARRARRRSALIEAVEPRRLLSVTFSDSDLSDTWGFHGMQSAGTIDFDGSGHITGGVLTDDTGQQITQSGNYVVASNGAVSVNTDFAFSGAMNAAKDVAVVAKTDVTGANRLAVLVDSDDATFSNSDLKGTWNLFTNGDASTDPEHISGSSGHGTVTFDGAGHLSGVYIKDKNGKASTFAGTYSVGSDGVVNLTVNSESILSAVGNINLSKDLVAISPTDLAAAAAGDDSRLIVLVHRAGGYSNASFKGTWTFESDESSGTVTADGAGHFTGSGTSAAGDFTMRGTYTVASAGTFVLRAINVGESFTSTSSFSGAIDATRTAAVMDRPKSGEKGQDDMYVLINSGQITPVSQPPTISSLTAPESVVRGHLLTLTANEVVDPDSDGKIRFVDFFVDSNGNDTFDGGDLRIGRDLTGVSNAYSLVYKVPTTSRLGDVKYFARATDNRGDVSDPAQTTVTINNAPPTLKRLVAAPAKVLLGKPLTLVAARAKDSDGRVQQVEFFLDTNGNSTIDDGVDTPLGTDDSAVLGWKTVVNTSDGALGLVPGPAVVMTRLTDNDGGQTTASTAIFLEKQGIDLTIVSAAYTPTTLDRAAAAATLDLSILARNLGNLAAGPYTYKVFLSPDRNFGDSNDIPIATSAALGLPAGSSRTDTRASLAVDISAVTVGSYFVAIEIDSANAVREASEVNNVFVSDADHKLTVIDSAPGTIDLTVVHLTYAPRNFDQHTGAQFISLSIPARNLGSDPSGPFSYEFVISANNVFGDGDDVVIGSAEALSLAGGDARTDHVAFNDIDQTTLPAVGQYFGIVKIDSENVVVESDETNNTDSSPNANINISA